MTTDIYFIKLSISIQSSETINIWSRKSAGNDHRKTFTYKD